MVIEEDELRYNEDGEIIGYEGEGRAILMYIALGVIFGFMAGLAIAGPEQVVLQSDTRLPNAETYCQKQGFDWGTYTGGTSIEPDELGIVCHPEEDGTWTTYYFDLNMTQIDKQVTTME